MLRLVISIILIATLGYSQAFAKSPPPGTGSDDVPANILLMLDTSGSMGNNLPNGDSRYPRDLAFDSLGNIYVAKYYDVVEKFDPTGEFVMQWGGYQSGAPDGKFDNISSIAVDSNDNIFVSDRNNARVQKFTSEGVFISKVNLTDGRARGIELDSADNLYAINQAGDVEKYSSTGIYQGTWDVGGARYLVADSSDDLYVTRYSPQRVEKYDSNGNLLSSFSTPFRPYGIEIDHNGDLWLSNWTGDMVYKYTTGGTQLASYGGYGSDPDEFNRSTGIAMDSSNNIWIADYYNHRIKQVDGTLLTNSGEQVSRLDAAKSVIQSIVSDSNLTGGANFGLMEWNSDATMVVEISDTGSSEIFTAVTSLTDDGATHLDDAMDLAQSYFLGPDSPMDSSLACQENILIVVSDGFWEDDTASNTAEYLFNTYGIKTFTVGFLTTGNSNYVTLSQKGGTYPDSPLYATNEAELLQVLSNYIQQIISSQLTFTAPTIIPSAATEESILQSTFTYKSEHQWKGRLLKYALLPDGNVGSLLWDAGDIMNGVTASSRNIWTVSTGLGASLNNFVATEIERLRPPMEEFAGTAFTDEELTDLINFVRGSDSYSEFPTGVDDEGETLITGERWKLADIYHSKSSIVGPPSAFFSDETNPKGESYYRYVNNYLGFKQSNVCGGVCTDRDEFIYVGSNAGMLHGFVSATGAEAWAFIPPSLLGSLKDVIGTETGETNSIYGVDGSPTVKDIFYEGQWRTVLLSGLRQGGHSYFALDITDAYNPKHLFTFASYPSANQVSYWDEDGNRTDYNTSSVPTEYDYSGLGESWSQPVILKLTIAGNDKWVGLIAGGYNNAINPNYGTYLYVIDMEDGGKIIEKITLSDTDATDGIVSSVPPRITAITTDSTTLFNDAGALVYVTDLEGKLWQVNLTDVGTLYAKQQLFDSDSTQTNGRYNFHELSATIANDQSLMLFHGTGNMQQLGAISSSIQNRAFGIKEENFPLYTSATSFNVSSLENTTNPGSCPDDSQKGWYINLDANEKVTAKAAISNDTVFLSRYTPNAAALCSPGTAKLSELNFVCGDTIRDIDLGEGVPTEAIIYENKIYIGVSDDGDETILPSGFVKSGNLIVGDPSLITNGAVRLESWREEF